MIFKEWENQTLNLTGPEDLSMEEIENSGLGPYYIDHTVGVWPQAAGGVPFNACEFQSKGDPITDLCMVSADYEFFLVNVRYAGLHPDCIRRT